MAEEGEDAVAMLSAPETLTEEEQEELRRELAKVRDIVCGPCALPCGFAEHLGIAMVKGSKRHFELAQPRVSKEQRRQSDPSWLSVTECAGWVGM